MSFRKAVFESFGSAGWASSGKLMTFTGDDVDVLVDVQKGFGRQWFCNVGFSIRQLSAVRPTAVHKSAMYYRLERLFPADRGLILTAGAMDDAENADALRDLKGFITDVVSPRLIRMAQIDALREHYQRGMLNHGLVIVAAQQLLSTDAPLENSGA